MDDLLYLLHRSLLRYYSMGDLNLKYHYRNAQHHLYLMNSIIFMITVISTDHKFASPAARYIPSTEQLSVYISVLSE